MLPRSIFFTPFQEAAGSSFSILPQEKGSPFGLLFPYGPGRKGSYDHYLKIIDKNEQPATFLGVGGYRCVNG